MADFEISMTDNSSEILEQLKGNLQIALEAVGQQAEAHAKQVISDSLVYGGIDLMTGGEKDNSRVDIGQMRNSIAHTVHDNEVYIGTNLEYAA